MIFMRTSLRTSLRMVVEDDDDEVRRTMADAITNVGCPVDPNAFKASMRGVSSILNPGAYTACSSFEGMDCIRKAGGALWIRSE